MKKLYYPFIFSACLLCKAGNSLAQKTSPSVVNATGGHFSNASLQLDFSVGEVVIASASNQITPGYLQPDGTGSLPISLLYFNGAMSKGQVELSWATSQEINGNHFDVERSQDGTSFTKLVSVKATGTPNVQNTYNAVDPAPFASISYYRLKQVDNNGAYKLSRIIVIVTGVGGSYFAVSPNPFAGSITIKSPGTPYQVRVADMAGKIVSRANYTASQTTLNLSSLAKGVYLLQLFTKEGQFVQSIKITKQ